MSDDRTETEKQTSNLKFSMMSSDRPLDTLIGGLSAPDAPLPQNPIHPRILELGPEEGDAWVLAMWADPGSAQELHNQLRQVLEATLIANLSRAAETGEALDRVPSALRLLVFSTTQDNLAGALKVFGFQLDPDTDYDSEQMATFRQEGIDTGWTVPERPVSSWTARLRQPATNVDGENSDRDEGIVEIHTELRKFVGDDCWGSNPGAFSRCAAVMIRQAFDIDIQPTLRGLDAFEDLVVEREAHNCIRWIPALLFQALADLVGVVIQQVYDHKVEWALCEPEENGFGPPPVFRITYPDKSTQHLSIGMHLLRWCIMPILDGEEIPRLSAWLESEFNAGAPD